MTQGSTDTDTDHGLDLATIDATRCSYRVELVRNFYLLAGPDFSCSGRSKLALLCLFLCR